MQTEWLMTGAVFDSEHRFYDRIEKDIILIGRKMQKMQKKRSG